MTFEAFLSCPPAGFDAACQLANKFSVPVFGQLAFDVSGYLQGTTSFPSPIEFEKKLEDFGISAANVSSVANALVLVFRAAARETEIIDPNTFHTLIQSKTLLSAELAQILARVWKKEMTRLVQTVSIDRAVSVGKVISMDWRLSVGFGAGSSEGPSSILPQPHIVISLKVADMQNKTRTHSFELTIPEFKAFTADFVKMGRGLEMYS